MRQVLLLALMIPLVMLLAACGSVTDKAEQISEEFSYAQEIVLTAEVFADYGDKAFEFELRYTENAEETAVEITGPEELRGLRAVSVGDGYDIVYDGVSFGAGELTGVGISPCEALVCLADQWKSGYVISVSSDVTGDMQKIVLETLIADGVSQKTWFDVKMLLPVKSEIYRDGTVVIKCEFQNVIVE